MKPNCRNGVRLRLICEFFILVAGCAAPIERSTGGGLFGPGHCRAGGSIGAANPVRNKAADAPSCHQDTKTPRLHNKIVFQILSTLPSFPGALVVCHSLFEGLSC
jgi:hypothetical protein